MCLDMNKIHTHEGFYVFDIFFGNINGLEKIKLTFLVNQVSFSFDVSNVVKIMANKVNLLSATNTPQRNHVVRFVGHYSTIISNTTKRFKCTFSFLIQLIGISNFCYLPYKHLRREVKRGFITMIDFVVEFEIIENLILPRHIRNGIANSISFLHRFEKQVGLFISRQKFYFEREFHYANILNNFTHKKIIINFKAWQSHSSHRAFGINGFPAPIL